MNCELISRDNKLDWDTDAGNSDVYMDQINRRMSIDMLVSPNRLTFVMVLWNADRIADAGSEEVDWSSVYPHHTRLEIRYQSCSGCPGQRVSFLKLCLSLKYED